MDINTLITIVLLLISGANLIMLLRLKNARLEGQLDMANLEKAILQVVNGKYQSKELAQGQQSKIDSLHNEIHGETGIRHRLHKVENRAELALYKLGISEN